MLAVGLRAPHSDPYALAEVPAGVATAGMLGKYVDPVDALYRFPRRCFHAAILARQLRSRQYDS